jgi:LysM repeat protein
VTPPNDSFFVRVPSGLADSTAAALTDMPPSAKAGVVAIESKKGVSLETVARKSGIPARQIAAFNPHLKRLKSGNLAPGQRVLVPTLTVASEAASIPDPEIERYGSGAASSTMHVVKPGETLGSIARKYGTTTAALLRANGLKRRLIFPGQSLVVKGKGRRSTAVASSSKSTAGKSAEKKSTEKKSTEKKSMEGTTGPKASAREKSAKARSGGAKSKASAAAAHTDAKVKKPASKVHGSASTVRTTAKKKAAS